MKRVGRWLKRERFKVGLIAGLVVLLSLAGLLQAGIDSAAKDRPGFDESSPLEMGRSVMDVLGGVRQSLAAYFWTKADTVFHEYMPHRLGDDGPLYPYYWMITRLDEHFEMPFYYASWMLCRFGRVHEGIELAREGIRYNPDSAVLQQNLAEIYFYYLKDPLKARYHNLKALALAGNEEEAFQFAPLRVVIEEVLAGKKKIPDVRDVERVHVEPDEREHDHEHEH